QRGRGTLRLVAVDASAFYPELIAKPLRSETRDPTEAERPNADTNIARQADKAVEKANADLQVAREESETANRDAQVARTVAYGAILIALLAIVSAVIFASRKKSTVPKHQWIGPETIPLQVTAHSPVAETQPGSNAGQSKHSETGDTRSSSPEAAQASISTADIVGSQSRLDVPGHGADTENSTEPQTRNPDRRHIR